MTQCFVRSDFTRIHQTLHVGVVFGDLCQLPVTKKVGPRVADVEDHHMRTVWRQAGDGGSHPLIAGIGSNHVTNPLL